MTLEIIIGTPEVSIQVIPGMLINSGTAVIDKTEFFQTISLLGELDTEQKRLVARTNLGVQNIDGGTFN